MKNKQQKKDYEVGQYIKFKDNAFSDDYYIKSTLISKNKKYLVLKVTKDWVYITHDDGIKNGWSRTVIQPYYEDGYLEKIISEIQSTF